MKDNIIYSYDIRPQHEELREEIEQVFRQVYEQGIFVGGKEVSLFESAFGRYLGAQHVIGCASGTDALELILRAMGIGREDEVIVPVNTWISDAEAVTFAGGRIRFADVDEVTGNVTPETLAPVVSPQTRAVIVVHMHGRMAEMEPLMAFAREHNLVVIEDCAHAAGAEQNGKKAGTWGDFGAYSFYPTKNLGALGDGGAVICREEGMARKIRLMGNHGQVERDVHVLEGKTSRLDTLQAAILRLKLTRLDQWNQERIQLAGKYTNQLLKGANLICPSSSASMVFHHYVIRVSDAPALQHYLHKKNILCARHYPTPLHLTEAYRSSPSRQNFPVAEKLAGQILTLPLYPGLSESDQSIVGVEINAWFRHS